MKLIRSPISWGVLCGIFIGYFGIPVLNPVLSNNWVWHQPYGFHSASILIFGALGCLVGTFFHYWISKRLDRQVIMWIIGICSLALVVGIIGIYRHHEVNERAMWSQVNQGFVRTTGANTNNHSITEMGIQITEAAAGIGAAEQFGEYRYPKLGDVASALSEAGYFMVSQKDKEKLQESIQFVNQTGSIIRQEIGNQSYPNRTKNFSVILSRIDKIIPNDFDKGYPAN